MTAPGPDALFLDGEAMVGGMLVLMHRAMSIAGGTLLHYRSLFDELLD